MYLAGWVTNCLWTGKPLQYIMNQPVTQGGLVWLFSLQQRDIGWWWSQQAVLHWADGAVRFRGTAACQNTSNHSSSAAAAAAAAAAGQNHSSVITVCVITCHCIIVIIIIMSCLWCERCHQAQFIKCCHFTSNHASHKAGQILFSVINNLRCRNIKCCLFACAGSCAFVQLSQ